MIRIVTDSTCDLPKEVIDRLNITIIPLILVIDGKSYRDEIDITRPEFYQRLPHCKKHPTTSLPSIGEIEDVFKAISAEGNIQILSIHISETLSGTVNVIRSAANNLPDLSITVVDGGQLSIGTGYQVELAAEMALAGAEISEILDALDKTRKRIFVAAGLDSMEYLRRSGRMNGIVTGIGSFIKLKPLLTMLNGKAGSELARTQNGVFMKLESLLRSKLPVERFTLLHTNAPHEVLKHFAQQINSITGMGDFSNVNITPIIGNHIGPGAVGFGLIQKDFH